jgi:hypothetical protein
VRIARAIVAVAALSGAMIAPGVGIAAGGQCRAIETAPGGWTTGAMPATPSAATEPPNAIVATSAVGQDSLVQLATDGVSVFRTADGGCSWQTVFTIGPSDYYSVGGIAVAYSVTSIANGHDATATSKQTVYLALTPGIVMVGTVFAAAPPELLAVSHDGGRTFAVEQPQPSLAKPILPECVSAPTLFLAPPADQKTIYIQCAGGIVQEAAESVIAGGLRQIFRSTDGGLTWNILGLPAYPVFTTDAHWMVAGSGRNELWLGGYTYSDSQNHLTAWRSTDGGQAWVQSTPDPKQGVTNLTTVGLAVDSTAGSGQGRVVVFNASGAYASTDLGKHWQRVLSVAFTDGNRPPVAGFFLHHVLHMVYAGEISCKGPAVMARYPSLRGKPSTFAFPTKWGGYAGWAADPAFAVVGRGLVATGLAHFCTGGSEVGNTSKLLTLRVG